MSDDIPHSWHLMLARKGIKPSYRDLGARADISHEAARRVVRGWSVKDSTVQKVADALGVDREVIHELRGEGAGPDVWEPPRTASLLTHEERDALSRLISLMTLGRKEPSDGAPIGKVSTDVVAIGPHDARAAASGASGGRGKPTPQPRPTSRRSRRDG